MEIKLKVSKHDDKIYIIEKKTSLELQKSTLPLSFRSIALTAKGHGIASFQVSYRYNKMSNLTGKYFDLNVTDISDKPSLLKLRVYASFISFEDEKGPVLKTGMTTIEINLPSGYVAKPDYEPNDHVKVNFTLS
jgi:hypothetical protein